MTKPHEQEWKVRSNGVVGVGDAVSIKVEIAPWRLPRVPDMDDWEMAAKVSHEVTNIIAAAPDMARALLEIRNAIVAGTLSEDAPEVAERALCRAGVL